MKSRFRMLLAAITFFVGLALLFAALALPLRLAAQDKQIPSLPTPCGWAGPGHCMVDPDGRLNGYCLTNTPYGCSFGQSSCFCPVGAMAINPGTTTCCLGGNCGHPRVDFGRFCRPTTPTPAPTPTPTVRPTATPTPTNT
jgi:hypothetical protein